MDSGGDDVYEALTNIEIISHNIQNQDADKQRWEDPFLPREFLDEVQETLISHK